MEADERAVRVQNTVGRLFQRLRSQAGGASDLSLSQEWIISLLEGSPRGMSSAELARAQDVTAQTMSNAVAALIRRGFVHGEPDPADRRRTVLFTTDDGAAALQRSRESKLRWLSEVLADLSQEELNALDEGTRIIERIISEGR
ncbi:MarR family winged helix-turn-helix transcriptional regulator [Microbacterium tumbae]